MNITVNFDSLDEFLAFGKLAQSSSPLPVPTPPPSPAPSPAPAPTAPQVRMLRMPVHAVPGALRWAAAGVTYAAVVATNGDIIIACLYSASGVGDAVPMTRVEFMLDRSLDNRTIVNTDEGLRDWLTNQILPPLSAWWDANRALMSGVTPAPVSSAPIPSDWSVHDRAAAALAQWVRLTPAGFVLASP